MSGDSWMYPYQRTPIGGHLWIIIPKNPREHNKYQGYTARDTPNCPLTMTQNYLYKQTSLRSTKTLLPSLAKRSEEDLKLAGRITAIRRDSSSHGSFSIHPHVQ